MRLSAFFILLVTLYIHTYIYIIYVDNAPLKKLDISIAKHQRTTSGQTNTSAKKRETEKQKYTEKLAKNVGNLSPLNTTSTRRFGLHSWLEHLSLVVWQTGTVYATSLPMLNVGLQCLSTLVSQHTNFQCCYVSDFSDLVSYVNFGSGAWEGGHRKMRCDGNVHQRW